MRKAFFGAVGLCLIACGQGNSGSTSSNETATTSGNETTAATAARFSQISVDEVANGLSSSNLAVYDANSRETYNEHHVPGATWVDYDEVSAEQLPESRDTHLVFYCGNPQCEASHVAAERAIDLGFSNVSVMGAGIQGWLEAGKPVETAAAAE